MALLCRIAFLEGKWRHDNLFSRYPPSDVAVFSQRLTMLKGRLAGHGIGGSVCHAWFIWRDGPPAPTTVTWIAHSQADVNQARLAV